MTQEEYRIQANFEIIKKQITHIEGKKLLNGQSPYLLEFYEIQIENKTTGEILKIYVYIDEKKKVDQESKGRW